ncbi:GAF and ANTAR domain-containing protein [Streptomyces poriticola]|uniref:GAF and ANTAR domain-containing protein n=1 Tax=Streptomyces poriticola TaxID=3120506 RepID=UPI002FCE6258
MGVRPSDGCPGGTGAPGGDRAPRSVSAADVIADEVRGVRPAEVPGRLCGTVVRLLPVTGASVSLRGEGLPVRLCASGERAAWLAELQATLGEGPGEQAGATGVAVLAGDLAAGADRWPVFAQEATGVGIRAVYALPLGNATACFGTLDLYRETPGVLTGAELSTARLVAAVVMTALTALPREDAYGEQEEHEDLGDLGDLGEYEAGVLQRRRPSGLGSAYDTTHQAVGMLMAQLGVDADEALARLRARAFACGRTAYEVARDVVTHRERFDRDR